MSKLPVEVLAALSSAQMTPDPSMFSALAQLGSLSNNVSNNLDPNLDFKSLSKSSSKPQSSKTPSGSMPSTSKSANLGTKKSRPDEGGFYQGLDLSLNKQRSGSKKPESRSKSPVSDND